MNSIIYAVPDFETNELSSFISAWFPDAVLTVKSSIIPVADRDITQKGCLKDFNPLLQLRALAEADNVTSAQATMARSHANLNLGFEPPKYTSPKVANFISEQEFAGTVLSIDENSKTFWARLVDRTSGLPDEEAEILFDEIPSDDWQLIVPGSLFSWNIGRELRDRQIRRVSEIRFRRSFLFSKYAIARAKERADVLASLITESSTYPIENSPVAQMTLPGLLKKEQTPLSL